jgi:predicted RNA-binding protein with PUA-like domain
MSRCWLMKSEPGTYSIDDLRRDGRTGWDGVRNYQARNLMQEMKKGDRVLFYHSSANPPGVAGLARVAKEAYPDDSARDPKGHYYDPKASDEDPRWYRVDIEFVGRLREFVPLADMREAPGLEEMVVTKRSRLSVQPVEPSEYEIVCRLGGGMEE